MSCSSGFGCVSDTLGGFGMLRGVGYYTLRCLGWLDVVCDIISAFDAVCVCLKEDYVFFCILVLDSYRGSRAEPWPGVFI